MPELLVAVMNGELEHDDALVHRHLDQCGTCQATAANLRTAEEAFVRAVDDQPTPHVRRAWLELVAGRESKSAPASAEAPAYRPEPPITPTRRGGLIGTMRRVSTSVRRNTR